MGCGDGHFAALAFDETLEVGVDSWWGPLTEARGRRAHQMLSQAEGPTRISQFDSLALGVHWRAVFCRMDLGGVPGITPGLRRERVRANVHGAHGHRVRQQGRLRDLQRACPAGTCRLVPGDRSRDSGLQRLPQVQLGPMQYGHVPIQPADLGLRALLVTPQRRTDHRHGVRGRLAAWPGRQRWNRASTPIRPRQTRSRRRMAARLPGVVSS